MYKMQYTMTTQKPTRCFNSLLAVLWIILELASLERFVLFRQTYFKRILGFYLTFSLSYVDSRLERGPSSDGFGTNRRRIRHEDDEMNFGSME